MSSNHNYFRGPRSNNNGSRSFHDLGPSSAPAHYHRHNSYKRPRPVQEFHRNTPDSSSTSSSHISNEENKVSLIVETDNQNELESIKESDISMVIALLGVTVPQIKINPTNRFRFAQLIFNNEKELDAFVSHIPKQPDGTQNIQLSKDLVAILDYPGCSRPPRNTHQEKRHQSNADPPNAHNPHHSQDDKDYRDDNVRERDHTRGRRFHLDRNRYHKDDRDRAFLDYRDNADSNYGVSRNFDDQHYRANRSRRPSKGRIEVKPLDVGLFRHSQENKDICGDADIGDIPTPMLLFQSLDPNKHTEEIIYSLVNKTIGADVKNLMPKHSQPSENIARRVFLVKYKESLKGKDSGKVETTQPPTIEKKDNPTETPEASLLQVDQNNYSSQPASAGFAFVEFENLALATAAYTLLNSKQHLSQMRSPQEADPSPGLENVKASYISFGSFQPASKEGIKHNYTFTSVAGQQMEYWNQDMRLVEYPPARQNDTEGVSKESLKEESVENGESSEQAQEVSGYALYQQLKQKEAVSRPLFSIPNIKGIATQRPTLKKQVRNPFEKSSPLESMGKDKNIADREEKPHKVKSAKNAAMLQQMNKWKTKRAELLLEQEKEAREIKEEGKDHEPKQEVNPEATVDEFLDKSQEGEPLEKNNNKNNGQQNEQAEVGKPIPDTFLDFDGLTCFLCSYRCYSTRELNAHAKSAEHLNNMKVKQRVNSARIMLDFKHSEEDTPSNSPAVSSGSLEAGSDKKAPVSLSIGAQMLQKMGWKENTGLGRMSDGIRRAIMPNTVYGSTGMGLGAPPSGQSLSLAPGATSGDSKKRKLPQVPLFERAKKR